MNIYLILIIAAGLILMFACIRRGFRNGLIQEFSTLLSLAGAVALIVLAAGLFLGIEDTKIRTFVGITLLIILAPATHLILLLIRSLRLIVRLPVISWLDALLGAAAGFLEGFALLYAVEYLLRHFILV